MTKVPASENRKRSSSKSILFTRVRNVNLLRGTKTSPQQLSIHQEELQETFPYFCARWDSLSLVAHLYTLMPKPIKEEDWDARNLLYSLTFNIGNTFHPHHVLSHWSSIFYHFCLCFQPCAPICGVLRSPPISSRKSSSSRCSNDSGGSPAVLVFLIV